MENAELARRLGATTLFSHIGRDQLIELLELSPCKVAEAGVSLTQESVGLVDHIVLLSGELEASRSWVDSDGSGQVFNWRVAVPDNDAGFALLSAVGSSVKVTAFTAVTYLSINGDMVDRMLGWSHLEGHAALAKHLKVFHKVPLENVKLAFERMQEREVAPGEAIVTQGEKGDRYYIILSGHADVWRTDPFTDETSRVAVLGEGDAFGEEALLQEASRNATVKMTTPGRLLVLTKSDFDELLKPAMVQEVSADEARDMLRAGTAHLLDCRFDMEYEESHIPGAQLVPLDKLREGVGGIDPEPRYIVYCRSGRRSKAATFLLRERGIKAWSLTGGITNWPFEVEPAPAA